MIEITSRNELDIVVTSDSSGDFSGLEVSDFVEATNSCLPETREKCLRLGECALKEVETRDVIVPSDRIARVTVGCSDADSDTDLRGCALNELQEPANIATKMLSTLRNR